MARKDGTLLRNVDSMHIFMPHMYPNRTDNEVYMSETLDLTIAMKYLEEKNKSHPEYPYKYFQVVVTAFLKAFTLRPMMNYFIANNNLYERNFVSAAFTIKKAFTDKAEEGLAVIKAKPEDNIETIRQEIYRQVTSVRQEHKDSGTATMDRLAKLPRGIFKIIMAFARFCDRRGWLPQSLIDGDPFQQSVVLANLGSLHLQCGKHHLTNWGTTSLIVVVGEIKKRPYFTDDGNFSMKDSVEIGFNVDERIADGYYFAKSIRLVKKLLEHPELLEGPLSEEVEID